MGRFPSGGPLLASYRLLWDAQKSARLTLGGGVTGKPSIPTALDAGTLWV